MGKAETAVNKTNIAGAKEQTELMVSELTAGYYTLKYVERDSSVANKGLGDFVAEVIGAGKESSNGEFYVTVGAKNAEGEYPVTVYEGTGITELVTVTGTLTENGKITWDSAVSGGSGEGGSEEPPVVEGKYKVTYNANGGTGAPTDSNQYEEGAEVAVNFTTVPTNSGRTFLGWATSKTAEEAEFASDGTTSFEMGTENVVLYAVWSSIVGMEVSYAPSGTYTWEAKYASSDLAVDGTEDVNLSSATGQDFNITKWKVLSENRETGEVKMVPVAATTGKVMLQGAQGYNNAVKMLNDACSSLYGNSSKGITARSINIEDIEGAMTEEALATAHSYVHTSNNHLQYGNQTANAYTGAKLYPTIYAKENLSVINGNKNTSGLGMSEQTELIGRTDEGTTSGIIRTATSIQPYQTYWKKDYAFMKTAFKGEEFNLLRLQGGDTNYWVASRCVIADSGSCSFGVRRVDVGSFGYCYLFISNVNDREGSEPLFPVVCLSSELLKWSESSGFSVDV